MVKLIICKISDTCLFERTTLVDLPMDALAFRKYIDKDAWHTYKTIGFLRPDGTMVAEFRKYGNNYLLYDSDVMPGSLKNAAKFAYPGRAYKFEREAHIVKRM